MITFDREYTDFERHSINKNYTLYVRMIGHSIIHLRNIGDVAFSDVYKSEEILKSFILKSGIEKPYIIIFDFEKAYGRTPMLQIQRKKEVLLKKEKDVLAYIICSAPFWMSKIITLTFNTYNSSIIFKSTVNFTKALVFSNHLFRHRGSRKGIKNFLNIKRKSVSVKDIESIDLQIMELLWSGTAEIGETKELSKISPLFPLQDALFFLKEEITKLREFHKNQNETNRDVLNDKECLIENFVDVTELKQVEYELKKQKDEAHNIDMAKSLFLANLSHEIRTPMNGVIGMTELMLDTSLDETQAKYLKILKNSGRTLLTLINDILDFSKIDSGTFDIEEINFNLRSLMDEFIIAMSYNAEGKGLELLYSISGDVPSFVVGDPGRIRQILTHLVGNSIKFTSKGSITILCNVERESNDSCLLKFIIEDTGIGIEDQFKDKLFDKFTQADSSMRKKYEGTGLGLTVSSELVRIMGGDIGFSSTFGEGSTFWFSVNLGRSAKIECADRSGNLIDKNVLLVNDDMVCRDIICSRLDAKNIKYSCVQHVDAAIEMLRSAVVAGEAFHIVIIDKSLSDVGAEAIGKLIKESPELKDLHMVLMASDSHRGDAKKFQELGYEAFLSKPLASNDFFDCLRQVSGTGEHSLITVHSLSESRRAKMKLLIVDDNSTNRILAKVIIKKIGYSTDEAEDGQIAIDMLAKRDYDLIFMDLTMPVMDGLTATKIIRKTSDVPIVAMTANAMKGDREMCLAAGMNDYISKPIDVQHVKDVLEKWLSKL